MSIEEAPKPAVDWLVEICLRKGWHAAQADALEAAEKWTNQFLSALRQEINQLYVVGRFTPIVFNSSSDYIIQGCAFIEPADPDNIRFAKKNRALYGNYWNSLAKYLSANLKHYVRVSSICWAFRTQY